MLTPARNHAPQKNTEQSSRQCSQPGDISQTLSKLAQCAQEHSGSDGRDRDYIWVQPYGWTLTKASLILALSEYPAYQIRDQCLVTNMALFLEKTK